MSDLKVLQEKYLQYQNYVRIFLIRVNNSSARTVTTVGGVTRKRRRKKVKCIYAFIVRLFRKEPKDKRCRLTLNLKSLRS